MHTAQILIDGWVNPFHATGLFQYPPKTLENLFRGYRKGPVA